jgi:ferredoxin--NADP+ reductase
LGYRILFHEFLTPVTHRIIVEAPHIGVKALPGQFVIVRVHEKGERVPFTISRPDADKGTIDLIFQEVGKTSKLLGTLREGDEILDLVGPLGEPTDIKNFGHAVSVGGGYGNAVLLPITTGLKAAGNKVTTIIGARTKDLIILEDDLRKVSDKLIVCTDDGSYGVHGFVTVELEKLLKSGDQIDFVLAIGPLPMMEAVSKMTEPYGIKTVVSLNPIMVDGTGMCGACRVEVHGETKFACVDGPEFDGHGVNYDVLRQRLAAYQKMEEISDEIFEKEHEKSEEECRCPSESQG